jgi:hypothetical protein
MFNYVDEGINKYFFLRSSDWVYLTKSFYCWMLFRSDVYVFMIYERVLDMIPGTCILVVDDAFTVTWEAKITMRAINIIIM